MRVLVDACAVRVGGGLSYALSQLSALERVQDDFEMTVLAAPWNRAALASRLASDVRSLPARGVATRFLAEQLALAADRADVVYCPNNFGPLLATRAPTVLTLQNPNYVGRGRRMPHNKAPKRRLRIALSWVSMYRATRIVLISEALRDELAVDSPRLASEASVLQSGAPSWEEESTRPKRIPPDARFFLSLANDYPHKRLDDVVAAWAAGARRHGKPPLLVMAGDISHERRAQMRRTAGPALRTRLVFLGPVARRGEVRWLLEHAMAMVSASELEAHPLTPAEAGSVGCPLVLSDIPPHREVASEHADYFGVGDVERLSSLLASVRSREERRWQWPVTWEENARALADILREAAGAGKAS